jgi:hypothetical protein
MANVPLVTGRRYRLNLWVSATQVTNAATSYLQVVDSTGQLATSRYFQANLAASEVIGGGSSRTFAATATGNATFTAQALSGASAFRIAANACEISIEDIGG